jgi:hypothetical protein
MIETNEREEILKKLKPLYITQTKEEFTRNYEFFTNLKRESNYKSGMSGIRARECWVDKK